MVVARQRRRSKIGTARRTLSRQYASALPRLQPIGRVYSLIRVSRFVGCPIDNIIGRPDASDLARGEPVHQRQAVEGLRLVDDLCLNSGEIVVKHSGAFLPE